jgi:hypothetical protein
MEKDLFESDQSRKRKKSYDRSKARAQIDFNIQLCRNIAELTTSLASITQAAMVAARTSSNSSSVNDRQLVNGSGSNGRGRTVTVLVMEDLADTQAIVPAPPALPELIEADEDAPVDIGMDEYVEYRAQSWATHPHRAGVSVSLTQQSATPLRSQSNGIVSCLTDPVGALNELLQTFAKYLVWVEGVSQSLCAHEQSILYRAEVARHVTQRYVSEPVHQSLVWCSVLQYLPRAKSLIADAAASGSGEASSSAPVSAQMRLSRHLASLFPRSTANAASSGVSQPRLVACVGGLATPDKFRVLDEILDWVSVLRIHMIFPMSHVCLIM